MQQLVSQSGFPVDYHVKRTDDKGIFLPPFYTHPHGYQMCVYVYPNGSANGEGTHVSIFTHMMQGPFDDYLHEMAIPRRDNHPDSEPSWRS